MKQIHVLSEPSNWCPCRGAPKNGPFPKQALDALTRRDSDGRTWNTHKAEASQIIRMAVLICQHERMPPKTLPFEGLSDLLWVSKKEVSFFQPLNMLMEDWACHAVTKGMYQHKLDPYWHVSLL